MKVLERLGSTSGQALLSISQNHSITEWFGLGGTLALPGPLPHDHRLWPFTRPHCSKPHPMQPWTINFRDGLESPASPGNLFQYLTTLTMNNFFLISRLNVLSFSLIYTKNFSSSQGDSTHTVLILLFLISRSNFPCLWIKITSCSCAPYPHLHTHAVSIQIQARQTWIMVYTYAYILHI